MSMDALANGFGRVEDALHEYRNSMNRSIDNFLKFLAQGVAPGRAMATFQLDGNFSH